MVKIVSVEGNIGVGKSTFIETSKRLLDGMNVVFLSEPVGEWDKIHCNTGENILTKFYNDQVKYGFSFQMLALLTRAKQLQRALIEHQDKDFIVVERSILTDRDVFCKMLYDDKKINEIEHQIYLKYFNELLPDVVPSYHLLLQASPKVCLERIHKRKRKGEQNILIDYLTRIDEYQQKMIEQLNHVVVCDADIYREGEQYEAFVVGLWNNLIGENIISM